MDPLYIILILGSLWGKLYFILTTTISKNSNSNNKNKKLVKCC